MYILGIDVGTTGTKALLIDRHGCVIAKAYKGYGLITKTQGVVEQDPDSWWDAVVTVVREATQHIPDKSAIAALSLSTQGASSLLLDESQNPIGNAITWMDGRSYAEKGELSRFFKGDQLYLKTGWPANECLDAAKLLWLKKHDGGAFHAASSFVSTMEYINIKLTGVNVIDPSNAAIRQLMNIGTSGWDEELLSYISFPAAKMPAIAQSGARIGTLTPDAARQTGLSENTRVYLGAHDQYCAALGAGVLEPGDMVLSTGTAWVMLGITNEPMFTSSYVAPARHVVDGLWGALASIPVAGASLDWLRKISPEDYAEINKNAESRMEKASDIFFYPYFGGNKFPLWQSQAKACWTGLGLEHDKYDLFRSVMEGVAFQAKLGIEDFRSHGACIDKLTVTGGASKSNLWLDTIAAVTGADIFVNEEKDAACVGAAMIAAVAEGLFENYKEAAGVLVKSKRPQPVSQRTKDFYLNKFNRYRIAWESISKIYN